MYQTVSCVVSNPGERLGLVNWRRQQTTPAGYCWDIGIALLPEAHGRGYGTQAHRLLARYLFAHTTVHRICAGTEWTTSPSRERWRRPGPTGAGRRELNTSHPATNAPAAGATIGLFDLRGSGVQMEAVDFLLVSLDQETADAVQEALSPRTTAGAHVVTRRNLDGASASWLVLGTLMIHQLPAVLTFVTRMIELRTVQSIKVGDTEITNPTRDQVELLLRDYTQRQDPASGQDG